MPLRYVYPCCSACDCSRRSIISAFFSPLQSSSPCCVASSISSSRVFSSSSAMFIVFIVFIVIVPHILVMILYFVLSTPHPHFPLRLYRSPYRNESGIGPL